MTFYVPPDFDPESSDFQQGSDISDIASQAGWATWEDVLTDPSEITNPDSFRPTGYDTPQDAISAYRDEDAILSYVKIYWDEETGLWYAVVDY